MATSAEILNKDACIMNNEKLVSALVASMAHDCTECLPILACCCGFCPAETKTVPVFVDTRGQYGQIVPNVGFVHTTCIRNHGVLYMCTQLPLLSLCELCHARRKVDAIVFPEGWTREHAIAEAITEYAARAAELKAAVAIHKNEPDDIPIPFIEPSAKRFHTSETPQKMFDMPGMTVNNSGTPSLAQAQAPAPATIAFTGMDIINPPKIPFPIASAVPKPQSGAPMTIRAKFNSKCAAGLACKVQLQIQAGKQVVWVKPLGVFHPQCPQCPQTPVKMNDEYN
jgi:hypothetical protein